MFKLEVGYRNREATFIKVVIEKWISTINILVFIESKNYCYSNFALKIII